VQNWLLKKVKDLSQNRPCNEGKKEKIKKKERKNKRKKERKK
jgi:hypothetical protein